MLTALIKLMTIISIENPHLAMMTSIKVDGSPAISKSETFASQFCDYFNCVTPNQPEACYTGDSEEACEILSVLTEGVRDKIKILTCQQTGSSISVRYILTKDTSSSLADFEIIDCES